MSNGHPPVTSHCAVPLIEVLVLLGLVYAMNLVAKKTGLEGLEDMHTLNSPIRQDRNKLRVSMEKNDISVANI